MNPGLKQGLGVVCKGLLNEGEGGANSHGLTAVGTTGEGSDIPGHHVDVYPGDGGFSELLQEKGGGDGSTVGTVGNVGEIGDLAFYHGAIGLVKWQLPEGIIGLEATGK